MIDRIVRQAAVVGDLMRATTRMAKSIIAMSAAVMIGIGASIAAADGSKSGSSQAQGSVACVEACAVIAQEILRQKERQAMADRQGAVSEKPVFEIRTLNDSDIMNNVFRACISKCREALR